MIGRVVHFVVVASTAAFAATTVVGIVFFCSRVRAAIARGQCGILRRRSMGIVVVVVVVCRW